MKYGIYMGAKPAAVREVRQGIVDILRASGGDDVKIAAFKAMTAALSVQNVTLNNAHVTGDHTEHHTHYADPEPEAEVDLDEEGFDDNEDSDPRWEDIDPNDVEDDHASDRP